MTGRRLVVVLKGYPRLSETFIAQEILNIERSGIPVTLVSLRHPTDTKTHPVHDEIAAPVNYLPEYLYQEPLRVLRSWWRCRRQPGYRESRTQFWHDLKRDRSANRIRRFGQALVMAAELPGDTAALYAHFLHTPASVTRYAALITEKPWACSAHAKDIYTSPDWELREKLDDLMWLTTCTRTNVTHLQGLASKPAKVSLNYHGLDLDRFRDVSHSYSDRDGSDPDLPVRILSVGRAVAKKGYDTLLDALARLPDSLHWQMHHIGGGALSEALREQAEQLRISDRIQWSGAQPQEFVLEAYRDADFFVLNSRIDKHGDRDGLPNVLVEAQSQGIAVLSTNLSGIPELIEDRHNGLLVESEDTESLTVALTTIISDPALRQTLGENGKRKVTAQFEMKASFVPLERQLRALLESA